jgi:hypothetical protein
MAIVTQTDRDRARAPAGVLRSATGAGSLPEHQVTL